MIRWTQGIADVVKQCTNNVLFVFSVLVRQRGGLETVRQTINRETAAITL